MKPILIATAMILSSLPASSFAKGMGGSGFSSPGTALASPSASPPALFTNRGGTVTGHIGQLTTTTVPGRAGQGMLIPNGNGTSTFVGPGGGISTVQTPR